MSTLSSQISVLAQDIFLTTIDLPRVGGILTQTKNVMMNLRLFFVLLVISLGMQSCTPDDEPIFKEEQATTLDSTDPSPEHEGDDEELDPNG